MAAAAERLAGVGDDLPLVRRLARRRTLQRINHALMMVDRDRVGRDASPTAAIIDSQSAETTEAGGSRGYDAGKKINGRKRHALADTDGRGLVLEPHPASIQDRGRWRTASASLAADLPLHPGRLRRQRPSSGSPRRRWRRRMWPRSRASNRGVSTTLANSKIVAAPLPRAN